MTIQQLADDHVGHPEELGEDSVITAQRESYKWGALAVLKLFEEIICDEHFFAANRVHRARELVKELKGEFKQ